MNYEKLTVTDAAVAFADASVRLYGANPPGRPINWEGAVWTDAIKRVSAEAYRAGLATATTSKPIENTTWNLGEGYTCVSATTVGDLIDRVNDLRGRGWRLYGNTFAAGNTVFQALTKDT